MESRLALFDESDRIRSLVGCSRKVRGHMFVVLRVLDYRQEEVHGQSAVGDGTTRKPSRSAARPRRSSKVCITDPAGLPSTQSRAAAS